MSLLAGQENRKSTRRTGYNSHNQWNAKVIFYQNANNHVEYLHCLPPELLLLSVEGYLNGNNLLTSSDSCLTSFRLRLKTEFMVFLAHREHVSVQVW